MPSILHLIFFLVYKEIKWFFPLAFLYVLYLGEGLG
jgi:hypothetical protein